MKSRSLLSLIAITPLLSGCPLPPPSNDVPNPIVIFPDRVAPGDATMMDTGIIPDGIGGPDIPLPPIDGGGAAQIRAVVTAPAGAVDLPIMGVLVTYLVPTTAGATVANDPPGFSVQAEGGPALFVAVDPATLMPPPVVGDRVSFRVTMTRAQNANASRWVATLAGWTRQATGVSLVALTQDFSSLGSLVVSLNNYEYQLSRVTGTITDSGSNSGSGFRSFAITTAGIPAGDPNLRMRIPQTLATTLGLRQGCRVTLGPTPLWRFTAQVQPSAWDARDIMVSNCGAMVDGGVDVPNAVDVPNVVDVPNAVDVPNGGCNAIPVINEIQMGVQGAATNEFVELYNPGNCALTLTGWGLKYATSNAMVAPASFTWTGAGQVIQPLGYIVLGSDTFTMGGGVAQGRLSAGMSDTAGGVGLYNPGGTLVNAVAWAQAPGDIDAAQVYRSGVAPGYVPVPPQAPAPAIRASSRIPNGANTGNPATDFQARTTSTPGAANM